MNKLPGRKGSATMEFIMAFMFVSICLLITLEFVFLAVGSELLSYATYMGSRAIKVYGNPERVVKSFTPWTEKMFYHVEEDEGVRAITVGAETKVAPVLGKGAYFSILNNGFVLKVGSTTIMDEPPSKKCEDNPLWYLPGSEPCM